MFDTKAALLEIITKHLPTATVWLYGSRARGSAREGSDYDIAIDVGEKIPWKVMTAIKFDIEDSSIPVYVDVIDVHSVSPTFLAIIKKEFVLWKNP